MKPLPRIFFIPPLVFLVLFLSPSPLCSTLNVTLSLEEKPILVNKPFTLSLTLSWEGEADRYLIVPPKLSLPDALEQKGSSFRSTTTENHYSLHYTYTLCAQKVGEYTINPISISFWKKGENHEEKINTDEVHAHVSSLLQYSFGRYLLPAAILFILLSLFISGFVLYKKAPKSRKTQSTVTGPAKKGIVFKELEECYAYKIKGDWANYLKKALSLRGAISLPEGSGTIMGDLETLLEKVLYGGYQPTVEEMNLVQRELEKAFKNAFPDTRVKE